MVGRTLQVPAERSRPPAPTLAEVFDLAVGMQSRAFRGPDLGKWILTIATSSPANTARWEVGTSGPTTGRRDRSRGERRCGGR